jgi:hypothetical protein
MFISEVPSNALDRFKKGKGREFSRLLFLIRAWDIREYYIEGKVD